MHGKLRYLTILRRLPFEHAMIAEEVGMGYMYIGKYSHEEIFVFKDTYIRRMFQVEYASISNQLHGILDPIDPN